MGLITDVYKKPTINIGEIVYAEPAKNSYMIQPMDTTDSRGTHVPATVPGTSEEGVGVTNGTAYALGDVVAYLYVASTLWGDSPLHVGIILCRIPVSSLGAESTLTNPKGAAEFYSKISRLQELDKKTTPEFTPDKYNDRKISGDEIIEGENTLHRVSSNVVEEHAGRCTRIMNALDGNITQASITTDEATIARTRTEQIVNESTLVVERDFLSTSQGYSKDNPRLPDRVKLTGDVVYGSVETTFNSENKPIAVVEHRSDGCEIHRAAAGVVFEQHSGLTSYVPGYTENINYDPSIEEKKEDREVFDEVASSANWTKTTLSDTDVSQLREPGDMTPPTPDTTDSEGNKTITTHTGKASFGFLPSGGFLVRDAWGSELRFEDGDIQMSAARNLIRVAGEDSVGIYGGQASDTARAGMSLASGEGNVDIYAERDINIHGVECCGIGATSIGILSKDELVLKSEDDSVAITANEAVVVESNNEIELSSDKVFILGEDRAIMTSKYAVVDCFSSLVLGSNKIDLHGDITIDGNKYQPGRICDVTISVPSNAAGSVKIAGGLYVKSAILTDAEIQAVGNVAAERVIVRQADEDRGVYLTRIPGRRVNYTFKPPTVVTAEIDKFSQDISEIAANNYSSEELVSTMFATVKSDVSVIDPVFCGHYSNRSSFSVVPSVADSNEKRYIYPGEAFWNSIGLITIDNAGKTDNIRTEMAGGFSADKGAASLRLTKKG